jgi:hypothetical protein
LKEFNINFENLYFWFDLLKIMVVYGDPKRSVGGWHPSCEADGKDQRPVTNGTVGL